MKTAFLTAFFAIIFCLNAWTQSCLPNGITFSTQTEIDNFSINYPGCTVIGGDVEIKGDSIANLDGLGGLTAVEGILRIDSCKALIGLNGLANLSSVHILTLGNLPQITSLDALSNITSVFGLNLFQLPQITNLNGLENITFVGGGLALVGLPQLTSLNGLENITAVEGLIIADLPLVTSLDGLANITSVGGGQFSISNLPQVTNLSSLENIMTIGGDIILANLPQVTSLNILENITAVGGYLNLTDLPQVTGLNSLEHITTIEGSLVLYLLPQITSLSGLDSLKSVGQDIVIVVNGALKSLQGLAGLNSVGGKFTISSNQVLSDCVVESLCNKLNISLDSAFIQNNSFGCNSPAEVKANCNLQPGQCLVNGISFYNQAEVDQFTINYPGCKEILGNLGFYGPDISYLDSLSVLTSLGGDLEISGTALTNLSGLENLTSIGRNFMMSNDSFITHLNALENVTHIGGWLYLGALPMLTSLAGLENSTFSSGASLTIWNNPALASLDKIGSFTSVYECYIADNNALLDLSGLETLDSIDLLVVQRNASLNDLTGLGNAYVSFSCAVEDNAALTSLTGLENIVSLDYIQISGNPGLTNLNALSNLKRAANCDISDNDALPDLSGLQNLDSVGGLTISYNASLTNLTALGNARGATYCSICNNLNLASLAGLEHFDSLNNLFIYDNPLLVNLAGLNNLAHADNCTIYFNTALSSLSGLENLKTVNLLEIQSNPALVNLEGLENLKTAHSLDIQSNPALINLEGLNSLRVVDYFSIYGNATLSNLAQFNSLDSLVQLRIYGNPALTNLNGLDSLKTLLFDWGPGNANLLIENNAALTDIHSLQNLTSVERIQINGNHTLSNCAIYPVCSRLATEPDLVLIENNAPGCNDPFEIETQCGATIVSVTALIDTDGDCQPFGAPAPHLMVHFSSPVQSIFRETDVTGSTRFILPAMDTFSLELPQILTDKWEICELRHLLQSMAGHDSISAFLLLKPLIQCPELTGNLALPSNFRSCLTSSDVLVSARNSGTVLAEAVRAAVVLPPVFELLASNPLASGQNGDTLFFELGDLHPFETGTVQLTVKTSCDTFLLGQTLCWEAFFTMDNPCSIILPAFSEIKLSATCIGDTLLRFTLKNIGDAPTQSLHTYSIFRNETVVQTQNFSLANQQSMIVDVPADGATYRMEATKFNSGTLTATALENCGGLTPGQITAFWLDKGPLEYDFDCRQVIGAFDPNQKTAVPTGAGQHYTITANRPIQYTIDFQNTGTDTAYRVLLRDVLPSGLDLETFRPAFSSHPCIWEIRGNTLEVMFSPIALPDSNVNEPASHGFFSFDIDQKPNLPDGTDFYNTASIIFDFNPPIVTNTVYHSIGKLTVAVDEPQRHADLWQLAGNPTRDAATFSALTFIAGEKRFELYDASGRPVRMATFSGQSFDFQRDSVPAGIYFFRIADEQGRWFTGKIVITD